MFCRWVFVYTYSADGNILSETDHNGAYTNYTYNMLGRLVSEIGNSGSRYYTYDAAGNRTQAIIDTTTTISYTYDTDGSLAYEIANNGSTSETTTYTYDLNGNLVTKSNGVNTTNYTYNVWGNMTAGAGATYGYNSQNLRTSKTVGNETDYFVLVGGNVWSDGETDYFRGIELISNGTNLYLYNIRGDVIQLVDYSGTVTKTYDYDAYGNELQRDLADENPFRYCGEYYDTETGFIYLRARYYDPMVGRFTGVDPIKSGLNWYSYCDNNPVTRVDKTGEAWETIFDLLSLGGSIAEVCANPYDPWAWGGLAGDTLDVVVPFLGGVGEAVKAFKYANKVMDVADDIIDAGDTIHDLAKAADRIEDAADTIHDASRAADKIEDSVKATSEIAEESTSKALRGSQNPNTYNSAKKGREMHKNWDYGEGIEKEVSLGKGNRADAIDFDNHIIYELKPNNPKAIARGNKQLERYKKAAESIYGGHWTTRIIVYD